MWRRSRVRVRLIAIQPVAAVAPCRQCRAGLSISRGRDHARNFILANGRGFRVCRTCRLVAWDRAAVSATPSSWRRNIDGVHTDILYCPLPFNHMDSRNRPCTVLTVALVPAGSLYTSDLFGPRKTRLLRRSRQPRNPDRRARYQRIRWIHNKLILRPQARQDLQ